MARSAVEQMMAQAEAAESPPPPRSSQLMRRPVAPARSQVEAAPASPSAPPPNVPRMYEEDDQGGLLDPTSLFGLPQSGATMLLDVSLVRVIEGLPSPAASAPRLAPELVVAQLDADRSPQLPALRTPPFSGAELVVAAIAFAAVLLPALYFVCSRM